MTHLSRALIYSIFLVSLVNCTDHPAAPSFTLKGYTTKPAGASIEKFVSNSRGEYATVSGCDGSLSTCCASGSGCKPSMMNLTLYKLWVSTSTDCSNGVLLSDNGTSPTAVDLTQNPTLISGTPADGTYKCVVLKMSDNLVFTNNQTTATILGAVGTACNDTTTQHTLDICRTGDTWYDYENKTSLVCSGTKDAPVADKVYVYITTDPTAVTGVGNAPVLTLTAALTVSAANPTTTALVIDYSDKINDDGQTPDHCWMAPSTFGFYKL